MNPHQKNKIDINSLSSDEQRLFRLYGKLPNKKDLLQNKLKERKYFDSGDYALSKAGKASDTGVTSMGTEHPKPEDVAHHSMHPLHNIISRGDSVTGASPPNNNPLSGDPGSPIALTRSSINGIPGAGIPGVQAMSRSPNKEASLLARSASMDEQEERTDGQAGETEQEQPQFGTGPDYETSVSPPPRTEGIPIRR